MTQKIFTKLLLICVLGLVSCGDRVSFPHDQGPVNATIVEVSADAQAIYAYLAFREYLQEKNIPEAIKALEQALDLEPAPELFLELANLHWSDAQYPQAALVTKKGLELYPDSLLLLTALIKIYTAQGRHVDAVVTMDEYLKHHPDNVDIRHEFVVYLLEQHDYSQALDRLQAIPKALITWRTNFLLGKAYAGLGLYERAIKYFQQVLQEDDGNFEAWIELGLIYEAQKNNLAAAQIFARLLDAGLDSQEIIFQLVELNLKLNNPDQALDYVKQYTDNQPLVLESANLMLDQGFYDHAAALLDPVAAQDEIPDDALFFLARLEHEGRDNPLEALNYLEAIPADHPLYERSLIFRIHLLYQDGDKEKAKELSLFAQDAYPDQPEFQIVYADILELEDQIVDSLEVLSAAQKKWPDNTRILYRLGVIYDRLERKDQTLELMEKIIALDPDHGDALNYLGYTLAEQGVNLDRALTLITRALEIEPNNGYFIDSLAWVYFKQGKLQRAWKEIRRAVQFVSTDPIIWEHYGDIARDINLVQESKKAYYRSLSLEGQNKAEVQEKLKQLESRP